MKIETLMNIIGGLERDYKIGLDELLLLSFVHEDIKKKGEVTITFLLSRYPFCSPATTHARMKRLIKAQLLGTVVDEIDSRKKALVAGKRFGDLAKFLERF